RRRRCSSRGRRGRPRSVATRGRTGPCERRWSSSTGPRAETRTRPGTSEPPRPRSPQPDAPLSVEGDVPARVLLLQPLEQRRVVRQQGAPGEFGTRRLTDQRAPVARRADLEDRPEELPRRLAPAVVRVRRGRVQELPRDVVVEL